MFKNMKHLITLALPVVALTFTSCGDGPKTITYEQMRRFASETYDGHALDTIPVTYIANLNKLQLNADISYSTPEGGSNSFNISFGFNGIHLSIKDKYAVVLSSTLVDTVEKYYSDFVGLAVSIKQEPPIQMLYQLLGNNCSKIDFVASEKIVGSVLIKLLQFVAGTIDLASSVAGFIPLGMEEPTKQPTKTVWQAVLGALSLIYDETQQEQMMETANIIFTIMDYVSFNVSNSSKSSGEVFNAYLTTDSNGVLNKLDFNFKSDFNLSGLLSYKKYTSKEPQEGDRPIPTAPYHFSVTGSFDFDFDISSEIVY